MSDIEHDITRCVELLLSMTQDQRQTVLERANLCRNCLNTECGGWCDFYTPVD